MDLITKIILINFIVCWSLALFDRHLISDALSNSFLAMPLGLWAAVSLLSLPVLVIYHIALA